MIDLRFRVSRNPKLASVGNPDRKIPLPTIAKFVGGIRTPTSSSFPFTCKIISAAKDSTAAKQRKGKKGGIFRVSKRNEGRFKIPKRKKRRRGSGGNRAIF